MDTFVFITQLSNIAEKNCINFAYFHKNCYLFHNSVEHVSAIVCIFQFICEITTSRCTNNEKKTMMQKHYYWLLFENNRLEAVAISISLNRFYALAQLQIFASPYFFVLPFPFLLRFLLVLFTIYCCH